MQIKSQKTELAHFITSNSVSLASWHYFLLVLMTRISTLYCATHFSFSFRELVIISLTKNTHSFALGIADHTLFQALFALQRHWTASCLLFHWLCHSLIHVFVGLVQKRVRTAGPSCLSLERPASQGGPCWCLGTWIHS